MKVLITCLLLCLSIGSFSQKIIINKVNQDGSRIVSTDAVTANTGLLDRDPLLFAVMAYVSPDKEIQYYLSVRINSMESLTIPQNGIILFKTISNKVIECKQQLDDYKTQDILGTYLPMIGVRVHTASGMYPISGDDLMTLSSEGITKVRIETEMRNIDSEYSAKKGVYLARELAKRIYLVNQMATKKSDIREGF
jgi:hypothetical protein